MPLLRCQVNGKVGWKYGKHGKCYVGKNGKKRAIQQMKAIIASGYKPEEHSSDTEKNNDGS